ncbi:MAG: DUF1461 domain-containing protein [Dehalococcoidales bacterium]|nr:DUF1461 domain-containing protein [Dehalococcoidales bacterium]
MKIFIAILRLLFIVCLPVLLVTATIAGAVNCGWLYTHGFEKYDVRQSLAENGLNLTSADMKGIAGDFIHYFNSGDEYINLTVQQDGKTVALFNIEEAIHFKDVKKLFRLDYYVVLGTFVYCMGFILMSLLMTENARRRVCRSESRCNRGEESPTLLSRRGDPSSFFEGLRATLPRDTIIGSGLTLVLMCALGIVALLDFDSLFLQFHFIAFSNDFWSAEGNMLLLFPGGFWYDAAIYCVIAICVLAVVLIGVSWVYQLFCRKKELG